MTFGVMPLSPKHEKRLHKVGEKLRLLRQEAGYTSYEKFAYDNELNRVQYGRMEKGSNMTLGSLLRVLDVHKVSLEDFFKSLK
jgi:hypothetical protein